MDAFSPSTGRRGIIFLDAWPLAQAGVSKRFHRNLTRQATKRAIKSVSKADGQYP
jgi:hypothetical protein